MARLLRTAPVRFDRSLLRFLPADPSQVAGTPYLGYAEKAGPQLPGDRVGYFHHPGSLDAMGLVDRLPPGSQSSPVWEPRPGWNAPGGLVRPARLLLAVSDNVLIDEAAANLDAIYPQLRPLGVTAVICQSQKARLAPHSALVPISALSSADAAVTQPGHQSGTFVRLRPTYLDTTFVGGKLMVAEFNSINWGRVLGNNEGAGDAGSGYTGAVAAFLPVSTPVGGTLWTCGLGDSRIVSFGAEARADLAAAQRLADGCEKYRHYVYQKNTPGSLSGFDLTGVDDAGIFADCVGSSDLVVRRVVSAADPGEIWSTFAADAVAFFSA